MLTRQSVHDHLAALASPSPTPGGGSASALAAAAGVRLLMMVCALPKTRRNSDEDRRALAEAMGRLRPLGEDLEALIDRDCDAYDAVVAAYKLSKATDDEQGARTEAIQKALRQATETPLEVMRQCAAALTEASTVAAHGSRNAASDVGVGLELLGAGLRGARLNVEINLDGLSDREYADRVRQEAAALAKRAEAGELDARNALR